MIELTSIVRSNLLLILINVSTFLLKASLPNRRSLGILYSSQLRKRALASAIRDHQTDIHAQQYLQVWKARLHDLPD